MTIIGIKNAEDIIQNEAVVNCKGLEDDWKLFKLIDQDLDKIVFLKFNDLNIMDKIKINIDKEEFDKIYVEPMNIDQLELIETD